MNDTLFCFFTGICSSFRERKDSNGSKYYEIDIVSNPVSSNTQDFAKIPIRVITPYYTQNPPEVGMGFYVRGEIVKLVTATTNDSKTIPLIFVRASYISPNLENIDNEEINKRNKSS